MRKWNYLLLVLGIFSVKGQVGINTETPQTTLEVVGKPDDVSHYDGIIPPRITGDQLAAKNYSISKKGAVVFVTNSPSNLSGQVINVTEPGVYFFDGSIWQAFSKEKQPTEYIILLQFDHNSTAGISASGTWSTAGNYWGNTNAYLTATKNYTIGTKNFGGLKGAIRFRKVNGIVNVWFQIYRSYDSQAITGDAFISIPDKGRSKHYYYYHCTTACGFRHNSEIVNDLFLEELSKFRFSLGAEKIMNTILKQNFSVVSNGLNDEKKILQNKLNSIEERIDKARDMYLDDKIDEEDFRRIKMKYKAEIENLTFKLNSLKSSGQTTDVEHKMKQALNAITKISERYKNASTIDNRAIVGLIYPEKLIFDGEYFQTTKINSLAGNIALINKELGNKKTDKEAKKLQMSVL